ncbi:MAG: hypothetical protein CMK09_06465 [Ponticaulis sp.]|nr:hypothetical protein [Ponticaulis sp.]|tara:strand:- start:7009 stop:8007 length:999 start_codon:yes stop_codon:yes gene_type:complete
MRVLITQEKPGHTETLASFIQGFHSLGYDVFVCSPDAYSNLTFFSKQGLKFNTISEAETLQMLEDDQFHAIVFNSAHLTIEKENAPFSKAVLKAIVDKNFDPRRVFRLHHSQYSAKSVEGFVELGTSALLAATVEHIFTPYARIEGFDPDPESPISINLLGGAYEGAKIHRNLEKLVSIAEYIDSQRLDISINWYLTKADDSFRDTFSRFDCFSFREGRPSHEILKELSSHRSFMFTLLRQHSRYHKQSLTGTLPFSVNSGIPLMIDSTLSQIYGCTTEVLLERNTPEQIVSALSKVDAEAYADMMHALSAFRDRQVENNTKLLGLIVEKQI